MSGHMTFTQLIMERQELQLKVEELARQNAVMHGEYSKYVFALDKISQLENDLATMTTSKEFLEHKSKCLEMERVSQETLITELKGKNLGLTQLLLRNQAFIRRVQIYEEGKPDKHDTMEDIRAALKGLI